MDARVHRGKAGLRFSRTRSSRRRDSGIAVGPRACESHRRAPPKTSTHAMSSGVHVELLSGESLADRRRHGVSPPHCSADQVAGSALPGDQPLGGGAGGVLGRRPC